MKIAITEITEYTQYRYSDGQTNNELFAGNFGTVLHNANHTLFHLDQFDVNWCRNVPLKEGEKIFRYETDTIKRLYKPFIKINLEKCLIYFLTQYGFDNDYVIFETKGIQLRYLNFKPCKQI